MKPLPFPFSDPPSRRNSLSKETIGVESESETNLVSGQHAKLDFVEKEQEILEEKVCGEDGGEPSETTPIIESSIEEESAAEAVVQSDIIEKAPGEPEEEKVEKKPSDIMQEDEVLGADWGLVVNPAEAVLKTSENWNTSNTNFSSFIPFGEDGLIDSPVFRSTVGIFFDAT